MSSDLSPATLEVLLTRMLSLETGLHAARADAAQAVQVAKESDRQWRIGVATMDAKIENVGRRLQTIENAQEKAKVQKTTEEVALLAVRLRALADVGTLLPDNAGDLRLAAHWLESFIAGTRAVEVLMTKQHARDDYDE